jgi:hypothetical protein
MSIVLSLLFSLGTAHALPSANATWTTLDLKPAKVECTTSEATTWCKSGGLLRVDSAIVAKSLESFHTQVKVFEAVLEMTELEKGLLHVVLDYPYPFDDRDYVARFTPSKEGTTILYRWAPETHAAAPITDNRVRLTEMEGEWRVEPRGEETFVQYTWHGSVGGNFPDWALPKARAVTGGTVLTDLSKALNVDLRPAE